MTLNVAVVNTSVVFFVFCRLEDVYKLELTQGRPEEHGRTAKESGSHLDLAQKDREDNDIEGYSEDIVDDTAK